jgi:integrase
VRLTATNIRLLTCPPGKSEQTFFDDDLPGFGLRARPSGSQSWLVQYAINGQTRKVFLGSPAVVDPGKAREAAKTLLAAVRLGRDPASEKATSRARAAETFGALLPRFLERQRARLKPRSLIEAERHLLKHMRPLHPLAVERIDRRAIAQRLTEIAETSGPGAANRTRGSLSAYFTWLIRSGYTETNPTAYVDQAVEPGPRTRVLADQELKAIWLALDDSDYGAILKLLLLTGARRSEVGALRRSEIDFEAAIITLPPGRTKNSREHVIPLSTPALAILEARRKTADDAREFLFGRLSGRGFQGWSQARSQLNTRLAVAPWTPHDFRRSLSTWAHERGVQPHVVEQLLGHVGGHKAGVAGTYNRASYLSERRRVLERWGEHIIALASGQPAVAQVVKLR